MRIGFTGTRSGMSERQAQAFRWITMHMNQGDWFIHGDCVGADAEAHDMVVAHTNTMVETFPATHSDYQAHREADFTHDPKPALQRDQDIVDACDVLIAAPYGAEEVRSGTWATVRRARKAGKPVIILER